MSTFYIASLKHTTKRHEHIMFWNSNHRGYILTLSPGHGLYCFGEAVDLNDGIDFIAVPADVVTSVLSPEPYYKPGARFYDTRGPVVDNTRATWNALIAGSLKAGRETAKIKPEVFRGTRRSFAWSPA